jgi:hypothetical protein
MATAIARAADHADEYQRATDGPGGFMHAGAPVDPGAAPVQRGFARGVGARCCVECGNILSRIARLWYTPERCAKWTPGQ